MRGGAPALSLALAFGASACSGRQSSLDPAGPYASEISSLWWIFFTVCAVVWTLVVAALLIAAFRRRHEGEVYRRGPAVAVASATGVTILILFALLFLSTMTGRALARSSKEPTVMIHVTGQQWWWKAEYDNPVPMLRFETANDIVVPVGEPVALILRSKDVIHSFWVPNIHGKRDLLPGHTSRLIVQADRPGTFEGQCAEFCGMQHANMRLTFRAVPREEFAAWSASERKAAAPPSTPAEAEGQRVFLSSGCPMCHTVKGTDAGGKTGPDLTHLASRPTIAAGARPNVTGHLAGWIVDPQGIKPGSRMPPNTMRSEDLQALLVYLRSLK